MDSLTQLTLGAAVGEACIGRRAGHRAWIWGAVLGTLPDLDILAYPFMDIVAFTQFHRGPSHSITLLLPLSILLAHLFPKIHSKPLIGRSKWGLFAFLVLITHALLDCFTTWGTRLFWPFGTRIAWESIFVIDPFYTLPLLAFLIAAILLRERERTRVKLIWAGLLISSTYLGLTLANKAYMDHSFEGELSKTEEQVVDHRTRPTPLNNFLWSAIARTDEGNYLIGYHTLLAPEQPIDLRKIEGQHELLKGSRNYANVQGLIEISKGYYAVEEGKGQNLRFYDLRFGELFFWEPDRAKPVFTYRIQLRDHAPPKIERIEEAMGLKEGDFQAFLNCIWKGVPKSKSDSDPNSTSNSKEEELRSDLTSDI